MAYEGWIFSDLSAPKFSLPKGLSKSPSCQLIGKTDGAAQGHLDRTSSPACHSAVDRVWQRRDGAEACRVQLAITSVSAPGLENTSPTRIFASSNRW
jgi:hypothetical protein